LIYITFKIEKSVLIHFVIPMGDILKALVISDVIDDDDAVSSSVITVGDSSKPLLTCSVPLG
jgi:hypothetical protein